MRELTGEHADAVSGGCGWIAVLGAVVLVANVADILYNAGQAFADGYEENDNV